METQKIVEQTQCYIAKANKFLAQVRSRSESYLRSVLEEAQKHVQEAENYLHDLKLKNILVLKDVPSELDGLTLIEKPDVEVIDKLLTSDLLEMVNYQGFE